MSPQAYGPALQSGQPLPVHRKYRRNIRRHVADEIHIAHVLCGQARLDGHAISLESWHEAKEFENHAEHYPKATNAVRVTENIVAERVGPPIRHHFLCRVRRQVFSARRDLQALALAHTELDMRLSKLDDTQSSSRGCARQLFFRLQSRHSTKPLSSKHYFALNECSMVAQLSIETRGAATKAESRR